MSDVSRTHKVPVEPPLAPGSRIRAGDGDADIATWLSRGDAALEIQGDLRRAREYFVRAADAAVEAGDEDALGRAVLGWSGLWVHESRGVVDAARVEAWRERALGRLSPTSRTARRLVMRAAAEVDYVEGSVGRVERALAEARDSSDPVLLGEALSLAHHCMLGPQHAARRSALANELVVLGATDGRSIDLLMGLAWRTVDLLLTGDPHADRALSELRRMAKDSDHLATLYLTSAIKVMHTMRSGRLDEAEQLAAGCYEFGERVGDADALGWYGAHLCAIRWYQRRTAELAPLISELVSSHTLAATNDAYLAALAVSSAAGGMPDQAVVALGRLRGRGLAAVRSSSTWMVALLGAAIAAHALGDREVAGEVTETLTPYADLPVMASLGVACFGSAHYPLALAALTLGEVDRARTHSVAAVRHNEAMGNLPAARMARDFLASLASPTSARHSPKDVEVRCQYVDKEWLISFRDREVLVPDSVGLRYLAVLVGHPGTEIRATELADRPAELVGAQPVLDSRAVAEYRRRLQELQEEMTEAADDEVLLDRAQREYDALMDELMRNRGLGGRARGFSGSDERARTSVQKAIRRAVKRIRAADPTIAEVVEHHLVTGFVCCYRR